MMAESGNADDIDLEACVTAYVCCCHMILTSSTPGVDSPLYSGFAGFVPCVSFPSNSSTSSPLARDRGLGDWFPYALSYLPHKICGNTGEVEGSMIYLLW